MFLKLHYASEPFREFLVNIDVIAGVEINGMPDNGSVLTLTTIDEDGDQCCECVRETFEDIARALSNARLMIYC